MRRLLAIAINSPAVRHGVGLFETLLVVRGRATFVAEHFARMSASASALGFAAPTLRTFLRKVSEAAGEVATQREGMIRVQWLARDEEVEKLSSWMLVATAGALPKITLARRRYGDAVTLPRELVRTLPAVKSTSWLVEELAQRSAVAARCTEGFFTDARGRYLEGSSTNLFAVRGSRLITAPLSAGVLPGIVRAWVIENAKRVGWDVTERAPSRADLVAGSFMTSSLTKIVPLRELDGVACAAIASERFVELQRLFSRELNRDQKP